MYTINEKTFNDDEEIIFTNIINLHNSLSDIHGNLNDERFRELYDVLSLYRNAYSQIWQEEHPELVERTRQINAEMEKRLRAHFQVKAKGE